MSLFSPDCLAGKRALVTGASSGLGAHFAGVLARAGAEVVLAARRVEALERVATEIGGAETLALDVSRSDSITAAAPALARVDILVNNAGIVSDGSALDLEEAAWDAVLDTNLKGLFLLSQAAARAMQGRGGAIVNIASILGFRQAGGVLPYAVSKAAVIQLTKTLALEWARHGVRVNALAPGYISTDLNKDFWESDAGKAMLKRIPQRRLGRVEELDGALLLLASDAGSYMTGSVITADGGHLVSTL